MPSVPRVIQENGTNALETARYPTGKPEPEACMTMLAHRGQSIAFGEQGVQPSTCLPTELAHPRTAPSIRTVR